MSNPNVSAEFGKGTVKGMEDIINNSVLTGKALETGAGSFFEGGAGLLSGDLNETFQTKGTTK